MDEQQFWELIAAARSQVIDPVESGTVALKATSLPAARPVVEIVAAQQVLWDLVAESCTNPLWAAAYFINGGCSEDGFDHFRGWLIAGGREAFERVVADPDALAQLPIVQASAADGVDLEGEDMLGIAWNAHLRVQPVASRSCGRLGRAGRRRSHACGVAGRHGRNGGRCAGRGR
ncbi:DUF4240 domain-containing protein [Streptomyces sp. NPDC018036]|uniref:DUF4240 domain-containing protein n=1 Tax=Streptomyces sp. NPDC018036 TaxID=3365035 RepID=UPI00379C4987